MKYVGYFLILIILLCGIGYYLYNKPNSSLGNKKPDYVVSADQLFGEYEKDENAANKKFNGKVVEVGGDIQSVNKEPNGQESISLKTTSGMFGVICKVDSTINLGAKAEVGQPIIMKGLCTGMLMDVVLIRCVQGSKK